MPIDFKPLDNKALMLEPLRQYKFVVLYCSSGKAKIDIDNRIYEITNGQLLTITPKQFYQFVELYNVEGAILEFTYDFFCRDDKTIELIYHNGLFCHFGMNTVINIPDNDSLFKVENYFKTLNEELKQQQFEFEASIHAAIKLLIIEMSRCLIVQQKKPLYTPDALFLKFLNLVRDNFTSRLTIKEFAAQLGISETKLNALAKKNTGETTQQLINDLIILEAKRLMKYQNLNVKQVAYELGFDDTHYFSRFFKKQTSIRAKDQLRISISR